MFKHHHRAVVDLLVMPWTLQLRTPNPNQIAITIQSSPLHCPVKRKKKGGKKNFQEWKVKYMWWPVKSSPEGNVAETGAVKCDETGSRAAVEVDLCFVYMCSNCLISRSLFL